jgi:fermentation-respiration switch protein FrsA (DUF1100 family)
VIRLSIALVVTLTAFAVLVALVWVYQRHLLYLPDSRLPLAGRVLPDASEVEFTSGDGLTLGGWLVPPRGPSNGAAVLIFNGNAGNRAMRAPIADAFSRAGFVSLLFDYRGYGGNPGSPTEPGLIADGKAARRYLASLDEVDAQRIVYYGESLGTGVAVAVAAETPPIALVLRSPFHSMVAVGELHYPWLPVNWMLKDRYSSGERIGGVECPLLVIAGEADRIVPYEQSRFLFEAASMPVKQFIAVPRADHNDPELIGQDVMDQTIAFLVDETDI